ncbi:hypothetical protein ACS0TY_019092 [Phlomoides rotata]
MKICNFYGVRFTPKSIQAPSLAYCSNHFTAQAILPTPFMSEKGRPLPKFGEWDVNDPASAEGFTVIFNKARDEKKTSGKPDSPTRVVANTREEMEPLKPQGNFFLINTTRVDLN